nr:hypothetical protein [uncultured Sphaerochaeta sp.]
MIEGILEVSRAAMEEKLGLTVVYDPMPAQKAEPHVRLTFMGTGDQGAYDVLSFQLTVVAAGDGPDFFVPALVQASLKVHDLFSGSNGKDRMDVPLAGGSAARIQFKPMTLPNGGQFIENEREDTERNQFRYTYVEPHVVTISFPRDQR